jgi:hypothetical protein
VNEPALPPPIYTIGYGARSVDEMASILQAHAIEFVIDVRDPDAPAREIACRFDELFAVAFAAG